MRIPRDIPAVLMLLFMMSISTSLYVGMITAGEHLFLYKNDGCLLAVQIQIHP